MERITMKYDQGIKKEEVVTLEISKYELEQLIENDFRYRLANSDNPQEINRRTAQEIIGEWNRQEFNAWRRHNRYIDTSSKLYHDEETDSVNSIADYGQMNQYQKAEEYEALCQKVNQLLKPAQAKMIIAICIDGMSVKDYANLIGENYDNVKKRFARIKMSLSKIW